MSIADLGSTSSVVDINILRVKSLFLNGGTSDFNTFISTGYSTTFVGPFSGTPPTVQGRYRVIGNTVYLSVNGVTAPCNSSSPLFLTTHLSNPPPVTMNFPIWVTDNTGGDQIGNASIDTNGAIAITKGFATPFSNTGTNGYYTFTLCYNI